MKKQLTKFMARQGDLLFVQFEENLPKETKIVQDGVLARGESTGHAHRLAPEDLAKAKVYQLESPRRLVIEADQPVHVVHEEHGLIALPAGRYEVRQQQEYTPQEVRFVAD